ncbi:Leucine-rich repeat-containing protein 40 [Nymphon striatum]|nr:Leucine-rich repeat-containing protein 40 [Nymphon striatum]
MNKPKSKVKSRIAKCANPVFFNQKKNFDDKNDGVGGINFQLIKQARQSGQLNLSNRSLVEVPEVVCKINSLTSEECKSLSLSIESGDDDRWWDQVDLTKLILAFNSLRSIPNEIQYLPNLNILDLHDNQLTSLPSTIGELQQLTKLNLSHNKFEEIPEAVFRMKSLKYFHIQNNSLKSINDDIGNLSFLEELDLGHNDIKNLPHAIGFLSRVFKFSASHNKLDSLPADISSMLALRILELTNNSLKELPADISNLEHLEMLYLQHNKLKQIPVLNNCSNLKELHLGNNEITELTAQHIEGLPNIFLLDLKDNKVTNISEDICLLFSLERLDLTNNSLTNLPYSIGTIPNLKSLLLEGNSMRSIRRDILMRGTTQLLKWMRSRIEDPSSINAKIAAATKIDNNIGGGKPSRLSSGYGESPCKVRTDIYTMKSTKTLDYSNLQVSIIPSEYFSMAKEAGVCIVNFSKNQLQQLPDQLEMLSNKIQELNVGFNKITILPPFLSSFHELTYIDLRNNQLNEIHEQLSGAKNLREINLSFNRFTSIPSALFGLLKLEIIFLNDNQINAINVEGLSHLKDLATLDLHNNNISQVPPELGNLQQLKSLQLEGNAIRYPRPAMLAKGTPSLLQFLRDRISC